jgi:hypothetical protein
MISGAEVSRTGLVRRDRAGDGYRAVNDRRAVSSSDSSWLRLHGFPARTSMWFGWERGCLFALVDAPDLERARCLYRELYARARAPNNSYFDVVADSNRIAEPSREGNHDAISP